MSNMQPRKPYMLRSTYEWIADSMCTPYIVVDAGIQHVQVPQGYVQDGQIILNVGMSAVQNLDMTNEAITFSARFAGRVEHIYVPLNAVLAIYAKENGEGLFFATQGADDSNQTGASEVAIAAVSLGADNNNQQSPEDETQAVTDMKVVRQSTAATEENSDSKANNEADDEGVDDAKKAKKAKQRPTLTIVK